MVLKEGTNQFQLKEYLDEYLDTYEVPNMFRFQFIQNYLNGYSNRVIDSQIAQFYKEYGVLDERADMYKAFVNIIKHNHPNLSDMTILDVCGGMVPQLGRELAKEAKHVMVVDRNMVYKNNPDNLEPIQMRIESYRDLPKADMIVGLLPCEATQHIIDYSVCNKKDFVIALCGCWHKLDLSKKIADKMILMQEPGDTTATKNIKYAAIRLQEEPELGDLIAYDSPYQFPEEVIGNKRR
jgi:hypothetical protein